MSNTYVIVKDRHPRISEVLNDCVQLCVPTSNGESLGSILQKICSKIESVTYTFQDSSTIDFQVNGNTVTAHVLGTSDETEPPMDIFLIGGQSNARGVGSAASSPNPESDTVYQYSNSNFGEVTDEVGNLPSGRGSMWPTFGINYYRLTGRRICFVPMAVDGSGQISISDGGFGHWGPDGTLYPAAVAATNNAITAVETAGYTPVFRGVLWCQGENDARYINDALETQNQYQTGLTDMIADFRTEFGSDMPFYIYQTGKDISHSDVGYSAVRVAQQAVCDANPLRNKMISTNAFDFIARGLMADDVHWNQTALNEQGTIGAEMVVNGLDLQWMRSGSNLTYMKGNVGLGIKVPTSPIHIDSKGTTNANITISDSINHVVRIMLENKLDGNVGGAGLWLYNHLGLRAQVVQTSSSSVVGSDILAINSTSVGINSETGDLNLSTGITTNIPNKSKVRIKNNGQVVISTATDPHTSAQLDIQSTSRGLKIPTMTAVQMNAIASPASGLFVYNTDATQLYYYNGTVWGPVDTTGGGSAIVTSNVFNATSDWTGPSGGYYSHAFVHNLGTNNIAVTIWDETSIPVLIFPETTEQTNNNTLTIRVPDSPDSRFAGRITIVS